MKLDEKKNRHQLRKKISFTSTGTWFHYMMSEMVGTALDKNIFLSEISHHNILNILHYISWYKF